MRRQVSWIWAGESSETQSHPSWRHSPLLKPKKSEIAIPGFSHPSLSKICQARAHALGILPPWGFPRRVSTAVQKFPTSKRNYPWVYLVFYPHPLTRNECAKGLASLPKISPHHKYVPGISSMDNIMGGSG